MNYFNKYWIKIVQILLKENLHTREIARRTNIDIKIIHRELKNMLQQNILDYKKIANLKVYFLKENLETRFLKIQAKIQSASDFLKKYPALKPSFSKLYNRVDFLIFGSYAKRKEIKGSDLDLIIFSKEEKEIRKILEEIPIKTQHIFIEYEEYEEMKKNKHELTIEIEKNHLLFGKYKEFTK